MRSYGKELILDIHNCNPSTFNRKSIKTFFVKLCESIDMERCKLCWWDDLHTPEEEKETAPHLAGTTAIQFIKTSNITIHTLDILKRVYLNIFSCKEFDAKVVKEFSEKWFNGKVVSFHEIKRR